MLRRALAVSGIVLVLAVADHSVSLAQTSSPAAGPFMQTPVPGRLERLKERTKETWAQMKRRWSAEQREKYMACRKGARQQRLAGHKTRKFLQQCMSS